MTLLLAAAGAQGEARPLVTLLVLAGLGLAPFVALMLTSFVKIAVVLSILRSAIGAPQVPPTIVITGLAVLLSIVVMAPTGRAIRREVAPAIDGARGQALWSGEAAGAIVEAARRGREPVRAFLLRHADGRDRAMVFSLARRLAAPEDRDALTDRDLAVAAPAFVISELGEAFRIGFLLFVPFLVIDLVVSTILLSLGMHMLSPTAVSLPFKLLLFVMVDGWHLLARGLIEGYT